jgi:hypothetical protein
MSSSALSSPRPSSREESRSRRHASPQRHTRSDAQASSFQNRRLQDLHARVRSSLVNSGYAALAFIGCDVDHNRVILRGSVPSYHLKQLAQVHALRVEGIGRLDNQLKVRPLEVRGRGPC